MKNFNEVPTTNVGYKIIESKRSKDLGGFSSPTSIVLGHRENDNQYVTWVFNHRDGGFHWGHYFENYNNAKQDFTSRD